MTSLPGGASDKIGNQYEAWWTAFRAAEVLEGRADYILCEPLGLAGEGVEFETASNGSLRREQVKSATSNGRWTIHQLITEGIMAAAQRHIDSGADFTFVSSTDCRELATMTQRSRIANSTEELLSLLATPQPAEFRKLAEHWNVSKDEAFILLRRIFVEVHSHSSLWRLVDATYRRLFVDEPEVSTAAIRGYLESNLHVKIGPQRLWNLTENVLRRRNLVGDQAAINVLAASTRRHLNRAQAALPSLPRVERTESEHIWHELQDEGSSTVICHGRAGSGKTQVSAEVAALAGAEGWVTATVRLDVVDSSISSAQALGVHLGMSESPSILLDGVCAGSEGLLIVDQLDAVSLYSGRSPEAYDAVFELLEQLKNVPKIRVLLVVRTIDLQLDPRMQGLASRPDIRTVELGLLAKERLHVALQSSGIDPSSLSEVARALLLVPLHYSVYSRLSPESRAGTFGTLQDLYNAYTRETRREIERKTGRDEWPATMGALVTDLSEHERLTSPTLVLDFAAPSYVNALQSSHVIVSNEVGYQFFHESYFDYLFSRLFIATGEDLVGFLETSGQRLFRRAQSRQILEFLASTDRISLRSTVSRMLASASIRAHIKHLLISFLRGLPAPTGEDLQAIEPWMFSDEKFAPRLRSLLSEPGWFDAADELARWEQWFISSEQTDLVYRSFIFAARKRPQRATSLMRPFVLDNDWENRLQSLVVWSISPGLIDLSVELMEGGRLDGARGPIAVNSDFWSILHRVVDDDPAGCVRLLTAYLNRGLKKAETDGAPDPFPQYLGDTSQTASSVMRDLVTLSASIFVEGVTPFVARVVSLTVKPPYTGEYPRGRWAHHYGGSDFGVSDSLVDALERALKIVSSDSSDPRIVARQLDSIESHETKTLTAGIYAASDDSEAAVTWLLSDERNLTLGWLNSQTWSSRELIAKHAPSCTDETRFLLESKILSLYPAGELRWENRGARGHTQYDLLTAIPVQSLTAEGRRRLQELERKFGIHRPQPPEPPEAHLVGSPVPVEAGIQMSDEQWLRALQRYEDEGTTWRDGRPVGGSRELANLLGQRAESDPDRFIRLALKLDVRHGDAIAAIIRATTGGASSDLVSQLLRHALGSSDVEVARSACRALTVHAQEGNLTDDMHLALKTYAESLDPTEELARRQATNGSFYYGGDLSSAGLNSVRGGAALAISAAVFADHTLGLSYRATIEALAQDEILAVRACAADAVIAMMNIDLEAALNMAEALLARSPSELASTRNAERMLTYCMIFSPDRFAPYLRYCLDVEDAHPSAGRICAVLFVRRELPSSIAHGLTELPDAARVSAASMVAHSMPEGIPAVLDLLRDPLETVRNTASSVFYEIDSISAQQLQQLLQSYYSSDLDLAETGRIVHTLKDYSAKLPDEALTLCEMMVEQGGARELDDMTTGASLYSDSVIELILRFYRSGNSEQRVRCLDLIDELAALGGLDVDVALSDVR